MSSPRVEIEVLPIKVQRKGLDAFTRVGQEVREVLERRPASMVAVRIVRPRFIERTSPQDECRAARQGVVLTDESGDLPSLIAEPPELPIDRGLAGPGMLADTIVRRWQDHRPLYRRAQIYARDGLVLALDDVRLARAVRAAAVPRAWAGGWPRGRRCWCCSKN